MIRLDKILFIFLFLFVFKSVPGRSQDSTAKKTTSFTERVKAGLIPISEKSKRKYDEERMSRGRQQTLRHIDQEISAAKLFVKRDLDTIPLREEINRATVSFLIVKEGINSPGKSVQTHRNLTVSSAILTQLLEDLESKKRQLDKLTEQLEGYRFRLDSLATDTLLYTIPDDSAKIISYAKKLAILDMSIGPADSLIDRTLSRLQTTQAELDPLVFDTNLVLEGLQVEKDRLASYMFRREFPNIFAGSHGSEPFYKIIRTSAMKEWMALSLYARNYVGSFILLLTGLVISIFFLRSLAQRYEEFPPATRPQKPLVLQHIVFSSLLIVISLVQFLFVDPPFIVSCVLWTICIVSLTIIFRRAITTYWMWFWLNISLLFIAAAACNLILEPSYLERWIMMLLTVCGAVYGGITLAGDHHADLREKYIFYAIRFMVAMELISAVANIFGRYNLSKTLMICGYVGLLIAIMFLWTVRLINETLRLANSLYVNPDRKLFYINFDKLGDRVPVFLYVILCVGWVILVGRNYFEFKQLLHPFNSFIMEDRSIGEYTYTIRSILLFIGISGLAVMLSRFASFFATDPGVARTGSRKSSGFIAANWILLIRIMVITSGILLAFVASGIPLDRLTIIMGALGVGIGLGLQNLVTNLVSGLIIAFERPVSVGDNVEVNGKLGTMKSVGFRSSIITLIDGAHMIIPNGDLLSQHLVNWTMSRGRRRLVITVGVAYGSDLQQTKALLSKILAENTGIAAHPEPMVIAREFADSAINIDVIFWLKSLDQILTVRDEVLTAIDAVFREHEIVIPFPQRDIHFDPQPENKKPASVKKPADQKSNE